MKSDKKEITEYIQLVNFELLNQEYGVDISQVKEIIRITPITKVPKCPEFMEGIINLRGHVIPVIDLRKKLTLPAAEPTSLTRVMVIETEGSMIGVIVDAVSEVLRITKELVDAPPPVLAGLQAEYIKGVAKVSGKLIVILDLAKILTSKERLELKELETRVDGPRGNQDSKLNGGAG